MLHTCASNSIVELYIACAVCIWVYTPTQRFRASDLLSFLTDPLRTAQGKLSLKAFRLTPKILGMLNSSDPFSPER